MQNTTHTKLQAIRDKRKRWQTRLTRASNMLAKLAKQEARLMKPQREAFVKPKVSETTDVTELNPYFAEASQQIAALDVPDYLKRTSVPVISKDDPDLVEKVASALADARVKETKRPRGSVPLAKLTGRTLAIAAKEAAEDQGLIPRKRQGSDEERKKMPLSGREALAAIKAKSAEVTARRAKRKLS